MTLFSRPETDAHDARCFPVGTVVTIALPRDQNDSKVAVVVEVFSARTRWIEIAGEGAAPWLYNTSALRA